GLPLRFSGSATDAEAGVSWAATVNPGPTRFFGQPLLQPLTLNPDKTFSFDHVFTRGSHTVTVAVTDAFIFGFGVGARSLTVYVRSAARRVGDECPSGTAAPHGPELTLPGSLP